jgi:hypothetical protein
MTVQPWNRVNRDAIAKSLRDLADMIETGSIKKLEVTADGGLVIRWDDQEPSVQKDAAEPEPPARKVTRAGVIDLDYRDPPVEQRELASFDAIRWRAQHIDHSDDEPEPSDPAAPSTRRR